MWFKLFIFMLVISLTLGKAKRTKSSLDGEGLQIEAAVGSEGLEIEFPIEVCEECHIVFTDYVKCGVAQTVGSGKCVGLDHAAETIDWKGTGEMITAQDQCERQLCATKLQELETCYSTNCDTETSDEKSVAGDVCWVDITKFNGPTLTALLNSKDQNIIKMVIAIIIKHLMGPHGTTEFRYVPGGQSCASKGWKEIPTRAKCSEYFKRWVNLNKHQTISCDNGWPSGCFNDNDQQVFFGSCVHGSKSGGWAGISRGCIDCVPTSAAVGDIEMNSKNEIGDMPVEVGDKFQKPAEAVVGFGISEMKAQQSFFNIYTSITIFGLGVVAALVLMNRKKSEAGMPLLDEEI